MALGGFNLPPRQRLTKRANRSMKVDLGGQIAPPAPVVAVPAAVGTEDGLAPGVPELAAAAAHRQGGVAVVEVVAVDRPVHPQVAVGQVEDDVATRLRRPPVPMVD